MHFRLRKQLPDGHRAGQARHGAKCHRRPPRLRAADEPARDTGSLSLGDGSELGAFPSLLPVPRAAPAALQPREGQPAPPTAGVRCQPSWRQGAVRKGRTAVPAPTLARAVRQRRHETQAIHASAAAGCVAPRTARTGQAALSFPHLAWPV